MITLTRPMAAMIWKELRENAKWAALATLVLLGGFGVIGYQLNDKLREGRSDEIELLWIISIGGFAATALMLGLAQSLPESRKDRWALLAHRPISRTQLLGAKAIAGLMLYLLAVGLTIVLATFWLLFAAHLPYPFSVRMYGPVALDVFVGSMYLFAGYVIGFRHARWYGSRILPLAIPVFCSTMTVARIPSMLLPFGVAAVGLCAMALASWGMLQTGGAYRRQPAAAKVALGVSLFAGIACCVAFATVFIIESTRGRRNYNPGVAENWVFEQDDSGSGKFVLQAVDEWGRNLHTDEHSAIPTSRAKPKSKAPQPWLTSLVVRPDYVMHYPLGFRQRATNAVELEASDGTSSWYYLFDQRLICGLHRTTGEVVGWTSPNGYTPGPTPPGEQFPGGMPLYNPLYRQFLVFGADVYKLEGIGHSISYHFRTPDGSPIIDATDSDRGEGAALSTASSVYLLSKGNWVGPYPVEPGHDMIRVVYQPADGKVMLWYSADWRDRYAGPSNDVVKKYALSGEFLGETKLPLKKLNWGPKEALWRTMLGASMTPPIAGGGFLIVRSVATGESPMALLRHLPSPAVWMNVLSGVACAAIALLLARRYAWTRRCTIGWMIGAFLLGPIGLLTMLSLLDWPPMVRCPACRRWRVATQDKCPSCNAEFPLPELDGTEIFENSEAAVVVGT